MIGKQTKQKLDGFWRRRWRNEYPSGLNFVAELYFENRFKFYVWNGERCVDINNDCKNHRPASGCHISGQLVYVGSQKSTLKRCPMVSTVYIDSRLADYSGDTGSCNFVDN